MIEIKNTEIDLDYLFSLELTPDQYVMLKFIAEGDKHSFLQLIDITDEEEIVKRNLYKLYQKEFIILNTNDPTFVFDYIKPTQKAKELFEKTLEVLVKKDFNGSFEKFIDSYYNLFPAKVRQGNLLVKSDKTSCSKKMLKFIKEYKHDYNTILKATARYIHNCANDNFRYIKVSHYFIYKDGTSTLASECDQLLEDIKNNVNIEISTEITRSLNEDYGQTFI